MVEIARFINEYPQLLWILFVGLGIYLLKVISETIIAKNIENSFNLKHIRRDKLNEQREIFKSLGAEFTEWQNKDLIDINTEYAQYINNESVKVLRSQADELLPRLEVKQEVLRNFESKRKELAPMIDQFAFVFDWTERYVIQLEELSLYLPNRSRNKLLLLGYLMCLGWEPNLRNMLRLLWSIRLKKQLMEETEGPLMSIKYNDAYHMETMRTIDLELRKLYH